MAMRVTVCRAGLHARPAAVFVKAVLDSGKDVRIARPTADPAAESDADPGANPAADARSILAVLALDIRPGERVVVFTDDDELVDTLTALLEADQ